MLGFLISAFTIVDLFIPNSREERINELFITVRPAYVHLYIIQVSMQVDTAVEIDQKHSKEFMIAKRSSSVAVNFSA